jgi:superfamily II DNA/RNA helicase
VQTLGDQLNAAPSLNQLTIPDLWQQQAVTALRDGCDVVVQAPTGSGKTLIFELWSKQGKPRGQAIYTVPTRALANDKLAEWRARGWNVGIATGDLAENLEAPVIVATLETQKHRLIRGDGPVLLVVDEYQMIGDPDRGLNYELALALAPAHTQLLLLSGSVANPHHVVKWLERLGRRAQLVRHEIRPVPLDEVFANHLNYHLPRELKGYWSRLVAKALAEGLGPVLLFAPRRQGAEILAAELARELPNTHPLELTDEQRQLVGDPLARMLKSRIAYHHSGLSYAVRAGVIEPLAKAGQLRAVVATMGLAAGINFSLRSVAIAGNSYRRDQIEIPLRPDEILQMAGRAGRRGIDEVGYFLVSANDVRLREGYPAQLARSGMVDWAALLGIMHGAAERGEEPFLEAVKVQERLFTTKPIHLGVESSLKHPDAPCGLHTDAERARHVRRKVREILNSLGEWELAPKAVEVALEEIKVGPRFQQIDEQGRVSNKRWPVKTQDAGSTEVQAERLLSPALSSIPNGGEGGRRPGEEALQEFEDTPGAGGHPLVLRPLLSEPTALEKVGTGSLVELTERGVEPAIYGRAITVADVVDNEKLLVAKWVRRLTNWSSRQTTRELWRTKLEPLLRERLARQRLEVVRIEFQPTKVVVFVSLARHTMHVPVDRHGVALWRPQERQVFPPDCAQCSLIETCRNLPTAAGTAFLWKRLRLVDERGAPTWRGRVVSFFSAGAGLAIAAALEDEKYPLDELVYDLANLDAGFRFCREEDRLAGRLPVACRAAYGIQSVAGYLENGLPPKYGSGAEQVVAGVHKNPLSKHAWVTDWLGDGDIDRVIIEWRSLMRQIAHAPELDWPRWRDLQYLAKSILHETESPTVTELPRLSYLQSQRIEHRLVLRRH